MEGGQGPQETIKTERSISLHPHAPLVFLLPSDKVYFCKSLPFRSWYKAQGWDVKYTSVLNYSCLRPNKTSGGLTIRIK